MYYEDHPLEWFLYVKDLNDTFMTPGQTQIINTEKFYIDAAKGDLASYTFINPRGMIDPTKFNSTHSYGLPNNQHPPAWVREGERLFKDVYEALRNGPKWNETLFIITYDEHGGFYDHVSPPQDGIPNPDGWLGVGNGFNYTRLGVRIPTIAISPWIEKGTLIH